MKKIILLILLSLLFFRGFAQSNIRLNNYWGNPLNINPSAIYDKYMAVFSVAAHNQWIGFPGAPKTYSASASTYLEDYHTQLGIKLFQDKIGYTYTTNIGLNYGYAIPYRYDWQMHLGLGVNYQLLNYDLSQVKLSSADNEVYQDLASEKYFNADLGMEITNKALRFGLASQNIFTLFYPDNNKIQTNTNFVYAKYRYYTNDIVNYGIGVCGIQYSNIYQMEFNATGYFKFSNRSGLQTQPDLFDIGMYYRSSGELGLIFGFNITDDFHVGFSYDYHMKGIRQSSYGTNEIVLTYNLERKPICHNCWY